MANEQLGVAGLTVENKQRFEAAMLIRALPAFVHLGMGRKAVLTGGFGGSGGVPGGGNSVAWRRMERIGVSAGVGNVAGGGTTGSFIDGTFPAAIQVTVSEVAATVLQYGAWTPVGQNAWQQSLDQVAEEMATMYGELGGDTLDQVGRAVLTAGTSVTLSGSSASRSTIASCAAGFLAEADFRAAVRTLTRNNARRIPEEGGRFPAIVHPDTWFDFMGNTTIQNVLQNAGVRGNENPLFTGEMYDYLGIRAKISSNAKTLGSLGLSLIVTVYQTLVFGQEAYGEARFGSYGSPEIITHAPGTSGVSDPLNTLGTVGFKASLVVKILNDNFMTRIESSSSLNPQTSN